MASSLSLVLETGKAQNRLMTNKEIALELAAFLDSAGARRLAGPARASARPLVEALLRVAYEDLGKRPRLFDGDDVELALGTLLPGRLGRRDPVAADAPAVIEAFFEHLVESQVVTRTFEIRSALDDALVAFAAAVEAADTPRGGTRNQAPLVHHAAKLGRNDPCFCGSGKKFKKCCGKNEG